MTDAHATVDVTDDSFAEQVLASGTPVLVDFWAEWCAPCRMIAPVLAEIATEHQDRLTVAKLDIEANPGIKAQYHVESIPTLILFSGGEPVKRLVGVKGKAALLRELADVIG